MNRLISLQKFPGRGVSAPLVIITLIVSGTMANASIRQSYWDADVVERSELIAVGHLKENSIQYVPHTNAFPGGSWEHHATLVITSVIKGASEKETIPIIIHYGLEPVVGGRAKHDGFTMNVSGGGKDYPTNLVSIIDIRNSAHGGGSLVEDASKDNIWFLRRRGGIFGQEQGTGDLGIVDPEDVEPLKLKNYLELYLTSHPEGELRAYAASHPEVALRVERWLDHQAVSRDWQAVNALKDPQAKAAKMASYLRQATAPKASGELHQELRKQMPQLGADAVPALIEVLRAGMTNGEDLNLPVLILHDIGRPAAPAVPVLCELLEKPGKTFQCYICAALKTAGDPKAIPFVRPILKLPDAQAATEAAEALQAMGDTDSFDAIAALLPGLKPVRSSMDELRMRELLMVLHKMDRERAAPIVARYLEDPAWAASRDFIKPGN